jgi:hypothetical protein
MKTILKVIWGIFAVIGILFTVLILFLLDGKTTISIYPSTKGRFGEYVEKLRTSRPFAKDTVSFEMKIIQDPVRAKEIRDYFQLDQLYDADADTWTKALAIGKFVASNISHDNQEIEPEHRNAIDLWEYTKKSNPRSTAGCTVSLPSNSCLPLDWMPGMSPVCQEMKRTLSVMS